MQNKKLRGVILIKRSDEPIRLTAFFAFLIMVCLPFYELSIAGVGLMLLLSIPLLILCMPTLLHCVNGKIWDKATVCLVLFFVYNICAFVWTPEFKTSSLYNCVKITVFALCLYGMPVNRREQKLLLLGSILAALIVCWFLVTERGMIYVEGRAFLTVFGVAQDPNYMGYLFLVPMAIMVKEILSGKNLLYRLFCLGLVMLMVYTILLTGSRGAFLGIAAVVAVSVFGKFRTLFGKILFCIVMAAVALFLFYSLLMLLPEGIAVRFTIQNVVETRGTKRLDLWINVLKVIQNQPYKLLLGFGTGSSIPLTKRATHNFILQLLLEFGVVGTGLFFVFLIIWYKRLVGRDTMCLGILLGCMTMALTLSVNTVMYFWGAFMLSITCSKPRILHEQEGDQM